MRCLLQLFRVAFAAWAVASLFYGVWVMAAVFAALVAALSWDLAADRA